MAPSQLRVIVHGMPPLSRALVADSLRREPDLDVVAEVGADGLADACVAHHPDVVVLEVHDAEQSVVAVARGYGALVVGWCARHPGRSCAGGAGLDPPAGILADLAAHVRMGARNAGQVAVLRPYVASAPRGQRKLSARELDVLQLITTGLTAQEVGTRLGISAKTVNHHKQSIFSKLEVRSQGHAVAVALRQGLLRPRGGPPARS
ncbi:MAG: hypothetical protein QOG43_2509 [Actinomycetota bacterium]|jgi:DNA-binding NarL/FixJ family response regulator|nr:hypothetical protein [Actinomycetota bacterium]